MGSSSPKVVIPAEAGIQYFQWLCSCREVVISHLFSGFPLEFTPYLIRAGMTLIGHRCFSMLFKYFNKLHNPVYKNSGNSREE
jgi:hypothetical protein